jgi:hypothetical protein
MERSRVSPADKKPDAPAKSRKNVRPNALRNAQVLPPHHVDLTLAPTQQEDRRLPVDISGSDLARGSQGPSPLGTKGKR